MFTKKLLNTVDKLTEEAAERDKEIQQLAAKLEIVDGKASPKYLVSAKYQKFHVCLAWQDCQPSEWRTKCGWKYGASKFQRRSALPSNLTNKEKCLGRGACFDYEDEDDENEIDDLGATS